MKITVHPNTNLIYLTSETANDQYKIGRIAGKIKSKSVYEKQDNQIEISIDFKEAIEILAD